MSSLAIYMLFIMLQWDQNIAELREWGIDIKFYCEKY